MGNASREEVAKILDHVDNTMQHNKGKHILVVLGAETPFVVGPFKHAREILEYVEVNHVPMPWALGVINTPDEAASEFNAKH
jgi:hypothetical protein